MIRKSAAERQANGPSGEGSLSTEPRVHRGPLDSFKTCFEVGNAATRLW